MSKDKILMKNMGFYGYHGVLEAEKTLGQKFFIDVTLYLDTKEAGINDRLESSVSYAEVYQVVKEITENQRFQLLEALAEYITIAIFDKFEKIKSVKVKVKKPEAPVPGIYDYFGVEIKRDRRG